MRVLSWCLGVCLVVGGPSLSFAQQDEPDAPATEKTDTKAKAKEEKKEAPEPEPIVRHHEVRVNGKVLRYTTTTGRLPIKSAEGETEAYIFFMAYTLDSPPAGRPLTFSFNGGPGSSSIWLHLGAIGPQRVKLLPDGGFPRPPFELADNDSTWLDMSDIVFIDPVGTGYSRPTKKELGKKFWGVKEDVQSVAEFIRLYLSRYERWGAPLFLVGESYGTTRAAGLSGYLMDRGIALNGIVLVSSVLNFQTIEFSTGNDLPYELYLPSYAAAAWFHKKLPPELQQRPLEEVVSQAEQWSSTGYTAALNRGDHLSRDERAQVVDQLARLTGLSKTYLVNSNLRVEHEHFCKELLRDQGRTIGRLDSRFTGTDLSGVSETPDYDPSYAVIQGPFTETFNNYVRRELGYKNDMDYYVLGGGFSLRDWNWGSAAQGYPNVTDSLRAAMAKNPYLKLYVAQGYFDLATPFYAMQYTLAHLQLQPEIEKNISTGLYDAGHMMYIKADDLAKLKRDVAQFMQSALKQ
ncbi:MAG: peptidase S10 [Acidobacteriaceae bacterium]|nr:peptidase S10 [Acidobacteriaceae bacterium]